MGNDNKKYIFLSKYFSGFIHILYAERNKKNAPNSLVTKANERNVINVYGSTKR